MTDRAQAAADAVLDNLKDRSGLDRELSVIEHGDSKTWEEIRATLAEIIGRIMAGGL